MDEQTRLSNILRQFKSTPSANIVETLTEGNANPTLDEVISCLDENGKLICGDLVYSLQHRLTTQDSDTYTMQLTASIGTYVRVLKEYQIEKQKETTIMSEETKTSESISSLGSMLPDLDAVDKSMKEQQATTTETEDVVSSTLPDNKVLSLDNHSNYEYGCMLFNKPAPHTYLDCVNVIKSNEEYIPTLYKATGTFPQETAVIYDDYTFIIVNHDNASKLSVYVTLTSYGEESYCTSNNKSNWRHVVDCMRN